VNLRQVNTQEQQNSLEKNHSCWVFGRFFGFSSCLTPRAEVAPSREDGGERHAQSPVRAV
jgi:hypothetical protein